MRLGLLSLVATVVAAVPGEHVAGPASASGEPLLVAPAPGCFSGETGVEPLNGPSLSTYCPVTGTASPDNHKCLLSLPGQGNNYDGFSVFMSVAATVGYASFSIQYRAPPAVYVTCNDKYDDLDCGRKVREAKQMGGNTEYIKVSVYESVEYRVEKTLMFLAGKADRQPPANAGKPERWAECLNTDNTPKWESIAVMGGSEGAGQAAYVGYRRKVDRVMQFSGIDDAVNYNLAAGNYSPPLWVSDTWAGETSLGSYYGFGEVYDTACRAWRMNFDRFPMAGKFINVNLIKNENYGDRTHKFCSDRTHSAGGHLTTVWDKHTPKEDGSYVYLPVWLAMLGHPVGTLTTTTAPAPQPAEVATLTSMAYDAGLRLHRYVTMAPAPAVAAASTVEWVGPFKLGKPLPIASPSPVLVQDCDDYKSILQRWAHSDSTKLVSLVDTEAERKLVLDCDACAAGLPVQVVTLGESSKASQLWEYARGRLVHAATGLCLARAPEEESGLVLLRVCADAAAEDVKWTLETATRHVTSGSVCLAVSHKTNTTKCQCVF